MLLLITTVITICGWHFINFVGSNCSELFITRFMYICLVCDSDDSSLSDTNNNCSPRWIVHHQSRGVGSHWRIESATSPQLCLEACAASTTCILAHWTRYHKACWLFTVRSRHRYYLDHVTQFEIVRQCDNSSGSLHDIFAYHYAYIELCSKLHEWTRPTASRICIHVWSS